MSYPIKFLSLQKTELEYEVSIRGSTPAPTVDELRKQISKLATIFPSEDILESNIDVTEDLLGINAVLGKIKQNLDLSLEKSNLLRTENLLHHLYHRLNRLIPTEDTKDMIEKYSSDFRFCFEQLNSVKDMCIDRLISPSASETVTNAPLNITVSCDRGGMVELGKVKYDGKGCVRTFIQRINEFCEARGISDTKILSLATEILTGDALHWYRNIKNRVENWEQLVHLLKKDFDQPDYDYKLRLAINSRTQGEGESIVVYLAIMAGLFSRLSKPISESDKLEILLHNVRPSYATSLASVPEIKDIDHLSQLCRNYENAQARVAQFREPNDPNISALAPEFAYASQKHNRNSQNNKFISNQNIHTDTYSKNMYAKQNYINPNSNTINKNYVHAITPTDTKKQQYCPRCRVNTHNFRQCTASKDKIFCFICGHENVKTPQCPNCSRDKPDTPKN